MKLIFPNGEHASIELKAGKTQIGSAAESDILLTASGIAELHCEIILSKSSAILQVSNPSNSVALNGKQVSGEAAIKPGDLIVFGKIGARLLAMEKAENSPPITKPAPNIDSDGRTRIRQSLPKFILRGVSGITFGKNFALQGAMIMGRQPECDICIPSDEISRQHAKLQVLPDGIAVEDIGSANGTFINDKRIQTGMMKPGDELRLDTLRFMLITPQLEMLKMSQPDPARKSSGAAMSNSANGLKWAIVTLIAIGLMVAGLVASGLIKF